MLYVAGLELFKSNLESISRSISLSEGVPHRHTFDEEHTFISYAYHVSDITRTLVVNFNLIDKTFFSATITIRNGETKVFTIYRNSQLYFNEVKDFKGTCVSY